MFKTLDECRKHYEGRSLIPLAVMTNEYKDTSLVILHHRDHKDHYSCHRYFSMGDDRVWDCSVDGRNIPLAAVFSWLNRPCAIATLEENYVTPEGV